MLTTQRVTSQNKDFVLLVNQLDAYLAVIDGQEHDFYHQFNQINLLEHCIVVYTGETAVGCGAIKKIGKNAYEVKRMYVAPSERSKGIATHILNTLEAWSLELGATSCFLETGKRMPDAIALYTKNGYTLIPNYEPYIGVDNSVCFKKTL